jgi:peptidoglycan/xylan/chitin deacetylase (PgdA/CDA1 family)
MHSQQAASTPLDCRFAFNVAELDGVMREWLAADMQRAQLSPAFRAYYLLRSLIPLPVRQTLQRFRRVEASDRWFFPDDFVAALDDQLAECSDELTTIHPWPDGAKFAFVLTHDVETADGLRRVAEIADMEEKLGFRSSWNIVPYKYPIDRGLVADLQNRGFEIGIHGYNHDGKLFASRAIFDQRVPDINKALKSYAAVGFRAPMVHRNLNWMQSLDIDYDASCFDVDPYQAMPGGVGGVWPFIAGRFVELPYTLPQDHTLFIVQGERDASIWTRKLQYIADLSGMALIITHPDYLDSFNRVEAYRRFLETARAMAGMWHALPKDVATWWRQRDALILELNSVEGWRIRGLAAGRARTASVRAMATTKPIHLRKRMHASNSRTPGPVFECNDDCPAAPTFPMASSEQRMSDCTIRHEEVARRQPG